MTVNLYASFKVILSEERTTKNRAAILPTNGVSTIVELVTSLLIAKGEYHKL